MPQSCNQPSPIPGQTAPADAKTIRWKTCRDGRVEWWYDSPARSWVTHSVDESGCQVGDADYDGTKAGRDCSIRSRGADPGRGKPMAR